MPVGIVAGEEGFVAACRVKQGAAYADESQRAGGACFRCAGAGEGALQLRDALAQVLAGEVEQPADLLPGVAAEGEQSGDAQRGRQAGEFRGGRVALAAAWG
ncbi:MAG: hypothetical protein ABL956_18090 [Hyphomonadaceae bacterium]